MSGTVLRETAGQGDEAYLMQLGAAFERSKRWQEARDCYLEALDLDPRSERLRTLLEGLVERSTAK